MLGVHNSIEDIGADRAEASRWTLACECPKSSHSPYGLDYEHALKRIERFFGERL